MSAAQMDPHDKMRARDVSKVARGEQAPRPPHEFGTVSPPPPPPPSTPTTPPPRNRGEKAEKTENGVEVQPTNYQARHCYVKYVEYHRCIKQKGEKAPECDKLGKYFRSSCPTEWIAEWDTERKEGKFPEDI